MTCNYILYEVTVGCKHKSSKQMQESGFKCSKQIQNLKPAVMWEESCRRAEQILFCECTFKTKQQKKRYKLHLREQITLHPLRLLTLLINCFKEDFAIKSTTSSSGHWREFSWKNIIRLLSNSRNSNITETNIIRMANQNLDSVVILWLINSTYSGNVR